MANYEGECKAGQATVFDPNPVAAAG